MLAPLARKGVTIYTIGVGASADEEELETIAYPPIRVFHAENAQALSSIKDQLVGDICRGESSPPNPGVSKKRRGTWLIKD